MYNLFYPIIMPHYNQFSKKISCALKTAFSKLQDCKICSCIVKTRNYITQSKKCMTIYEYPWNLQIIAKNSHVHTFQT